MYGYTDICILFCLQYLAPASNASPIPLDPPAGFNEPQPGESTPTESVDINPDNAVLVQSQDQDVQVNLPKEGVDVGCQCHSKGEQLLMKSADTQTEFTFFIPKLRRMTFKFKRKTHMARKLPRGLPTKGCYLPLINIRMSIDKLLVDSNVSGSEDEGKEKLKPLNPQDDAKFVVFNQEYFKLFKRYPDCGAAAIHPGNSAIFDPNLQEWSQIFLE